MKTKEQKDIIVLQAAIMEIKEMKVKTKDGNPKLYEALIMAEEWLLNYFVQEMKKMRSGCDLDANMPDSVEKRKRMKQELNRYLEETRG